MRKHTEQPKIVVVTRKTRMEEMVERFNTVPQARFYIEHMGLDFDQYADEDAVYRRSLDIVRKQLDDLDRKVMFMDRGFLPNFLFTPADVVVAVGPDGLVVNTAKYLNGQPLIAVNPDPSRIDGVLVPFAPEEARSAVVAALQERAACSAITMAEATLNDGQQLLAFNDFLIGHRSHVSARYRLCWRGQTEAQSSSGVLVATGAGSTGWFSSMRNMAAAVTGLVTGHAEPLPRMRWEWDDPRLVFVVREPFASRSSGIRLAAGILEPGDELKLESQIPVGGVIFSDGIESDALAFNSGTVATVRTAKRRTMLVKK